MLDRLVLLEPGKTIDLLVIVILIPMPDALLNVVAVTLSFKDQFLLLFFDSFFF